LGPIETGVGRAASSITSDIVLAVGNARYYGTIHAANSLGETMAGADVLNVGDSDFKKEVLESQQPVLVDFWATWCAPCRAIAPAVEELATQYKGRVKVAKMNIDDNQDTPQQFGVRSIPTLLIFKGGKVVDQIVGAVPKSKLEDALKKVV
jgi:thioredoxin 1